MQQLKIHSLLWSGKIIIIYPGFKSDVDGYNGKYRKIAEMLIDKKIGAVIRTSNFPISNIEYAQSVKDGIREVISYAIENAETICGSTSPTLYLMGVSAGASAIAAIANEYCQIEKILLLEPSGDAGIEAIKVALPKYTGEVYIVVGTDNHGGDFFSNLATSAKVNKLLVLPNCDHQFRGKVNGKIFSKAPLWAFAGDSTFPSPDGGIELYD